MNSATTRIERAELEYPDEPTRRIRVRIERPRATGPGRLPVAILLHGFKGFMDWGFFPHLSERFAQAGFVTVSMNASGAGVGEDPLVLDDEEAFFRDTYSRQLEDIDRVRRFAAELAGVDPAREVLLGHSRGGAMAVLAAAERAPAALVIWASIDDADRVDEEAKRAWRRDGVLLVPNARTGQIHRISTDMLDDYEDRPERFDIVGAASRLGCPLLAIHGSADGTVPYGAAIRIADAAPLGRSVILQGADHGFGVVHPLPDPEARPDLQAAIDHTLAFSKEATTTMGL